MTIVQELRALIKKRGGDPTGVMTIAQAVKVLTSLETEEEVNDEPVVNTED